MLKKYLQLMRFDKPVGTLLLLWPTLWALFFASNGNPGIKYIIIFASGVFLTRSAGCAFNDIADSQFDKSVARTKNRPIASGAISRKQASIFAIMLSMIAFILAVVTLNLNTILLCIPAILIYITYPLFKRFFALPQAYLGIAFSFGILMSFMEIQGHINHLCILIFMANLLWVIGYDTIYALVDIEDDLKIGIKTSAITFGKYVKLIISICYIMFISIMAYIGIKLHLNISYFIGLCIATSILTYQIIILVKDLQSKYFRMWLLNNWVGFFIFFGILLTYIQK